MHEVLINRLGGLSLPRKSVVRLTDRPVMTLDVYCGLKTTMQQQQQLRYLKLEAPVIKTAESTNSKDPDEAAHYESPHQDLHCLSSSL